MKQFVTWMLTAIVSVTALNSMAFAKEKAEEKVLNVYNWSDNITDDMIKNFEKETGIKVNYSVYDTNEILHAKLTAGKTGYDIVVPSDRFAGMQIKAGLFKKLDKSQLPNWANIDPQIKTELAKIDPHNNHLVPWIMGYNAIGINTKKVKTALGDLPMPKNAWDLIFNPTYSSKLKSCGISFMDSGSEVLPPALAYIGKNPYSTNPEDYKAAGAMLHKVRPDIRVFSSSGYLNDLANGSLCVVMGFASDINMARRRAIESKNGNEIQTLIPEKTILFFDTMAIPKDAPHPHNALLWMNYIMRPEVHAVLTNKRFFTTPNAASRQFVQADIANDKAIFPTDEHIKNMIGPELISDAARRLVNRTFTKFKTGI